MRWTNGTPAFEAKHDEAVFAIRYMARFAQRPEMLGR
jgi:hypothetical protein